MMIFAYTGIYFAGIILIIFSVIIYIVYLFNYNKIKNIDTDIYKLLNEIINKYSLKKRWINVKGKKVFIVERNSCQNKIPLIFIHGTYSSSVTFYELISLLPPEYDCICIDLPNFGISESFDVNFNNMKLNDICEMYREFIKNTITELGYEKVNLVGHSLGAIFSLYFAKKYKNSVDKLFLLSIPGLFQTAGKYGYYSGLLFKFLLPTKIFRICIFQHLLKPLLYYFQKSSTFLKFWIIYTFNKNSNGNDIVGRFISSLTYEGYWVKPLLAKTLSLKCRTFILVGKDDVFLDDYEESIFNKFPHITLKKIENIGHNVHINYEKFIPEFVKNIQQSETKIKLPKIKLLKLHKFLKKKDVRSFPLDFNATNYKKAADYALKALKINT